MQLFFPELPKIAFSPSAAAPRGNNFEVAHYAALPSLATTATATATTMLEIWRETEAQAAVEIDDGEKEGHDSRECCSRGDKQTEVRD